eukprot:1777706-Amphidinium_carterae.4
MVPDLPSRRRRQMVRFESLWGRIISRSRSADKWAFVLPELDATSIGSVDEIVGRLHSAGPVSMSNSRSGWATNKSKIKLCDCSTECVYSRGHIPNLSRSGGLFQVAAVSGRSLERCNPVLVRACAQGCRPNASSTGSMAAAVVLHCVIRGVRLRLVVCLQRAHPACNPKVGVE